MTTSATAPLQLIQFDHNDIQGSFAMLNQWVSHATQVVNQLSGQAGTIRLSSGLDMGGSPIANVTTPSNASLGHVVTVAHADANYSAAVIAPQLEAGGEYSLKTMRQIGNTSQQEPNSTFLNGIYALAPAANNSTVSGSTSGSTVTVTVTSGQLVQLDGSIITYSSRTDSLPKPSSNNYVYYYTLKNTSRAMVLSAQYTSDNQTNRKNVTSDGSVIIAVVVLKSSGFDTSNSAAGATDPTTGGAIRILSRI